MGKVTGFLEYERELAPRRPATERVNDWFEIYLEFSRREASHPGCALHGLRRALLPDRMSRQQPDSRLERSGLSRTLERSGAAVARDQQLPGIHRPHLSCAVRSVLCARDHAARRHHQADRKKYRGARIPGRLDPSRAAKIPHREKSGRRRFGPRGIGCGPATYAAPDTPSPSTKKRTASAACCAMAFRSSSWRSTSSIAAWNRCPPRA